MGWPHFDINDHVPPGGQQPQWDDNYWEINLMCHLLSAFVNYEDFYESTVTDAMARLQGTVATIEDESSNSGQMELKQITKATLSGTLESIGTIFVTYYPEVKMKHLYTYPEGSFDPSVALLFALMDDVIGADTATQTVGGVPRFQEPCQLCLPFLPRITHPATWPIADETVMENHIQIIGSVYGLKELYKESWHNLPPAAQQSLIDARREYILSSPRRGREGRVIDFDNDLVCDPTTHKCVSQTDSFCVEGDDGTCSAMQNP
jgi:hypothetical protein